LSNPVHQAARDPGKVVLEGLHAVKHAIRFGARLLGLWSDAPADVLEQARALAPDIVPALGQRLETVSSETFRAFVARPPDTRLIGVAARPRYAETATGNGPIVLLDRPRHPGNLGAVIRVAAAADAAAVWSLGGVDPWSAAVLRGAAGLHFALPVLAIDAMLASDRPRIALHAEGEPLETAELPGDAILLFGSERTGLAAGLRAAADRQIAIPMRPGVSSLNLATAVAVVLYTLCRPTPRNTGQPAPRST
jgi:TrmH family RNA methyltransferase